MAVIYATKEMVTRMKARGTGGQIINVSSAAGRIPIAGASTYVASKHGGQRVLQLTAHRVQGRPHADRHQRRPPRDGAHRARGRVQGQQGSGQAGHAEAVADGILSALQKPRPNVYVPKSLGTSVRTGGLIPRRTGEWLNKVLGGERAALDALDDPHPQDVRRTRSPEHSGRRQGVPRMTLPASITNDVLTKLTGMIAASGGATYKLTEVYTGEVITALPQSSPEDIESRRTPRRARRRRSGPRGRCSAGST